MTTKKQFRIALTKALSRQTKFELAAEFRTAPNTVLNWSYGHTTPSQKVMDIVTGLLERRL